MKKTIHVQGVVVIKSLRREKGGLGREEGTSLMELGFPLIVDLRELMIRISPAFT